MGVPALFWAIVLDSGYDADAVPAQLASDTIGAFSGTGLL